MNYQACCPKCHAKVSRGQYFSTWRIHFRCGGCGARFRMRALGYFLFFVGFAIQALWFGLFWTRAISSLASIGLILLTFTLGLWLLPVLTPMRLRPET